METVAAYAPGGSRAEGWTWTRLSGRELNQAYPLVQAAGAPHTISSWRSHARRWATAEDDERGIVGLRGGWSAFFSLFFYEVQSGLRPRNCLSVPQLWMVDLGSRRHVAKVTLQAIDEVAHACGCDKVRLHVAGDGAAGLELTAAVEPGDCGYAAAVDGCTWLRCLHFS